MESPRSPLVPSFSSPIMSAVNGDGSTTPLTPVTWDPTNLPANIGLTVGNTTAKITSNVTGNVRATTGKSSSGQWYFEIAQTLQVAQVGFLTGSLANTSSLFTTGGFCFVFNGASALDGVSGPAGPTWAGGEVLRVAWNSATGMAWLSVNGGVWNAGGGADPSTGVGGVPAAPITGGNPLYPAAVMNSTNTIAVLNPTTFAYAVPPGFLAYGADPSPPAAATWWDPTKVTPGQVALSNANRTGTLTVVDNAMMKATHPKTSGIPGWSATFGATTSVTSVGFANNAENLFNSLGQAGGNSLGYQGFSGQVRINGAVLATLSAYVVGDTVEVKWNAAGNTFFARVNGGNWNNNPAADPATNTGGISMATMALTGGVYAAGGISGNNGSSVTGDFTNWV